MPDGSGEESVKAFVTLRAGAALTLEDLAAYCSSRMSRFMLPATLEVLAEMPRTPSGKPAKAELRRRA